MATTRWDFSQEVKRLICDKAAARCANPNCRHIARFLNQAGDAVISTGDAAHILPASSNPDAPRFQAGVPDEDIKSEANGIWLCAVCHRKADRDPGHHTVGRLRQWKALSEKESDYEPPSVALTLPGHFIAETLDQLPGLPGAPAKIGLHVLVGASKNLRAVCTKITLEVISKFGVGEFRCEEFYHEPRHGYPAPTTDWQSFMLTESHSQKTYFRNSAIGWLERNPAERTGNVILLRAKVYSSLGSEGLEPFVSPWSAAIVNRVRLEIDKTNSFAHLVAWADTFSTLARTDTLQCRELLKSVFDCQVYRPDWPMFVIEANGVASSEDRLELLHMEHLELGRQVTKTLINGQVIEAVYVPNGYIIQRMYAEIPTGNHRYELADIQEFWNGGGGSSAYQASRDYTNWWSNGPRAQYRLVSNGGARPGGYSPMT